jgi:indole-3-glycerol phosphate synthase
MNILEQIFKEKHQEVEQQKNALPLADLQAGIEKAPPPLGFTAALQQKNGNLPALIAEVKAASPSRGELISNFDPLRLACIYAENGAVAISVLTDQRYFRGKLKYLSEIALGLNQQSLNRRPCPLLRKDFLFDPYQIYESRRNGADAVLLIAAALESETLYQLRRLAQELGMDALVEVHNPTELCKALDCGADLVGINNRDLSDFSVDLEITMRLRPLVPSSICLVAESGIRTPEDIRRLGSAGVDAVLVGEALVTAPDIAKTVRLFSGL